MMFCYGFLSFAAVMFSLRSTNALSPEEASSMKEALHPFVMECAEQYGITEEQFQEAKIKGTLSDVDPCFISCFLKKANFFDSDEKLNVENALAFGKSHVTSEPAIQFFKAVGEECVKVNDEEDVDKGCNRAKKFFECVQELKQKMRD